ncbi:MAG: NAD(+) synthase, partial [Pseudorhizobium sp.]
MRQSLKTATEAMAFSPEGLRLDAEAEMERICAWIRETVMKDLRKRGVVLGLSGGIDSSVTAALCARALGPSKVTGVF